MSGKFSPHPSVFRRRDLICPTFFSPLLPGTCFATELKLLPLAVGALHLEAVRLIDANTNEPTDIKDLPDILVYDRKGVPTPDVS